MTKKFIQYIFAHFGDNYSFIPEFLRIASVFQINY